MARSWLDRSRYGGSCPADNAGDPAVFRIGHFPWSFLRITGLFLTAPLYGPALIPVQVKVSLAAALAAALAFWLPDLPAFPDDPASAIYQGAILGMAMQIAPIRQRHALLAPPAPESWRSV